MPRLTQKQKTFIEEYLIDLNGTQAAIRAGYSPESARQIAEENMTKPYIRARIDEALAERSKRTGVNQDRIIMELARIALVNPADVIDFIDVLVKEDASVDDLAAIASVKLRKIPTKEGIITEREIKFHDKVKTLELLGKHLGMIPNKVELSGSIKTNEGQLQSILEQLREEK